MVVNKRAKKKHLEEVPRACELHSSMIDTRILIPGSCMDELEAAYDMP